MLDDHNPRNRVLHRLCARAGLRQLGWHSLRHYYASALIAAGADVLYVRDQLGHASAKMTLDVYGHLFKTANLGVAERLDQAETAPGCNLSATGTQNTGSARGVTP